MAATSRNLRSDPVLRRLKQQCHSIDLKSQRYNSDTLQDVARFALEDFEASRNGKTTESKYNFRLASATEYSDHWRIAMTVHKTGSVLLAMREYVRRNRARRLGVLVIDEQEDTGDRRIQYQARVLKQARALGVDIWLFELQPAVMRGEDREIIEPEPVPTATQLRNAAPNAERITKKYLNCFRVAKWRKQVQSKSALVVMGKFQESCIHHTVVSDTEGNGKDSEKTALELGKRIITSSKLIQRTDRDPETPDWAARRNVDFYRYVGTRSIDARFPFLR